MNRRYSLRGLVLAAALALILLPLLAMGGGLVGIMAMNWSAISMAPQELEEAEQQIGQLVVERWDEVGSPAFAEAVDELQRRWDFALEVRSLDDQVRYASPTVEDGQLHRQGVTMEPTYRTAILQRGGAPLGLMVLWIWPKAALSGFSLAAQAGLAAAVATLTILLVLVLGWISRAILRPLKSLEEATAAVAEGRLDFAIPRSQVMELDGLGQSFSAMRDQLRSALAEQAALQEQRRELIAAIGHDLRTPLSSVRAFAEGLRDGLAREPARAAHYGEVILAKTTEVERLVEELFQFSRLELPETHPNLQRVELGGFLRQALGAFGAEAEQKGVALRAEGPELEASLDPDLMGRAVNNLVANALRHTLAGGEVRLTWGPAEGGVEIVVTDTGEGIPADQLPHLFTPMYRTDRSRSRRSGGAGLGLAITARIVALHGGRIGCESRVGEGSRFTITLARAE